MCLSENTKYSYSHYKEYNLLRDRLRQLKKSQMQILSLANLNVAKETPCCYSQNIVQIHKTITVFIICLALKK